MAIKLNLPVKKGGIKSSPSFPEYTSSGAVFPYSKDLERKWSFFDKYKEPYRVFKVIGKATANPKIMLPRAKFPVSTDDRRVTGIATNIKFIGKPRNSEQERVLRELDEAYDSGITGVVVSASTGFGKTFLGCYAIAKVGLPSLVLITKSDLEAQWRQSFKDFLGLDSCDVGIIKGDKHNVSGKKVVLGYVQSVMKDDRYPSWVYKQFGHVVADEVHLMAADKFSNCMWLLPAKYRLGLSATLDRGDKKQHVFLDHIGRTIIRAELLPMPFNVSIVDTGQSVPSYIPASVGRTMSVNKWLASNHARQRMISEKVLKAYRAGRNSVCFADTKAHLDFAYDALINEGIPDKDIGLYVGGMPESKLKEAAHKRVVLTTYKMTQYGTDYPHWDTGFLMTPRADVRQIVGRVIREKDGKKEPLIFDFVDSDEQGILRIYARSRMKWYRQKANKIVGSVI